MGDNNEKKLKSNPGFDEIEGRNGIDYCKKMAEIREELGNCPDMIIIRKENIDSLLDENYSDTQSDLQIAKRKRAFKNGRNVLAFLAGVVVLAKPDILCQVAEFLSPDVQQIGFVCLVAFLLVPTILRREEDEKKIINSSMIMLKRIQELFNSSKENVKTKEREIGNHR